MTAWTNSRATKHSLYRRKWYKRSFTTTGALSGSAADLVLAFAGTVTTHTGTVTITDAPDVAQLVAINRATTGAIQTIAAEDIAGEAAAALAKIDEEEAARVKVKVGLKSKTLLNKSGIISLNKSGIISALEFAQPRSRRLGKSKAMALVTKRKRRSSVDHSMQQKFGKGYYDITLSSGDPAVLDSASLSNEIAKAVKAGKAGKKNKNKRKKLKQKAKKLERLEKQLSKAKTEKKRAQLEKKRAKLEKQLNKLGLSDQGDDQASIGGGIAGGAPSIEITEAGQQQMDDDEASAAAAAASGGGGEEGGGGGGSS
mgnify:CR=1 FL=1